MKKYIVEWEAVIVADTPEDAAREALEMIQKQAKLPPKLLEKLQPFLEQCDLVKFAAQELEETWTQAWPDVFSPGVAAVATPVV